MIDIELLERIHFNSCTLHLYFNVTSSDQNKSLTFDFIRVLRHCNFQYLNCGLLGLNLDSRGRLLLRHKAIEALALWLRVVHTRSILFFKSMSERGGPDINDSAIQLISRSTQNRFKIKIQCRSMSDPFLSDIDIKHKISLNYP